LSLPPIRDQFNSWDHSFRISTDPYIYRAILTAKKGWLSKPGIGYVHGQEDVAFGYDKPSAFSLQENAENSAVADDERTFISRMKRVQSGRRKLC
jgi:hypothetical protein